VRFLGEQDGEVERLLKAQLSEMFKGHKDVRRAYLARIAAGDQTGIALCLGTKHGAKQSLVSEIGAIFSGIFAKQAHLDILFLTESQELALEKVCAPFYPPHNSN